MNLRLLYISEWQTNYMYMLSYVIYKHNLVY